MGASGPRVALVDIDGDAPRIVGDVVSLKKPRNLRGCAKALGSALGDVAGIGIAIAAPTDPSTGSVSSSLAYPWATGPLGRDLGDALGTRVSVLNDAEAHLRAHTALGAHPMLCLALGSGLGFAITDSTGAFHRPRPDTCWDPGHFIIRPHAEGRDPRFDHAVWGLASTGLAHAKDELGDDGGTAAFCEDVGLFVFNMARLFQPHTVVFAGGIPSTIGGQLTEQVRQSLARRWPPRSSWAQPDVLTSPYGAHSALIGAALYSTD